MRCVQVKKGRYFMDDVQNNVYDADKIKSIKKEFSRIGFSLTVYLLLVFAMQLLITFVVGILAGLLSSPGFSAFSENGWYTWIVTYLPQVLIAAPVCFLMLRLKGPQEAFEGNLGGADYSKIIVASIPVMYIGNILVIWLPASSTPVTYWRASSQVPISGLPYYLPWCSLPL
jgi:hypothetical protein